MTILSKHFWDNRAKNKINLSFEQISHLEENKKISNRKIKL